LAAAAVLLLDVLLLDVLAEVLPPDVLVGVPPADELPLLQAPTPRMPIATSGTRYLQPRRRPAVLFR
jgi:hypothetical protein